MLERGKISYTQTFYLLVNLVSATAVIYLPAISAQAAGRDAWMSPVVSTLPGVYLALVLVYLGRKYPGQTLIQYLQTTLGTWPGKIIGLGYIFFFLYSNAFVLREFGELMVSLVMPQTPLLVFHVLLILLCAWAIRGGLEILARTIELTYPFLLFLFFIVVILTVNQMNLLNLAPVLEDGIMPVLRSAIAPTGWRGEIILLAMFLPFLARQERAGSCAVMSVVFVGLILAAVALANTAVLGDTVARLNFPTFALIKEVSMGNFIEHIESVFLAIGVISIYGKIALFYYATVLGAAQLANLKDYRPLVFPIGVLLAVLSIQVVENSLQLVHFLSFIWPFLAYVFEYLIPTIILGAAAVRGFKPK